MYIQYVYDIHIYIYTYVERNDTDSSSPIYYNSLLFVGKNLQIAGPDG